MAHADGNNNWHRHAGVARRYGAHSCEGGRAFEPPEPRQSFIFPLISAVLPPIRLYHVVLASHINWKKIKTDHLKKKNPFISLGILSFFRGSFDFFKDPLNIKNTSTFQGSFNFSRIEDPLRFLDPFTFQGSLKFRGSF